MIIKCGTE